MGQAPPHQACLRGGIPARGLPKHRGGGWATTHPCHLAPALTWTAGNSPQGGGGASGRSKDPHLLLCTHFPGSPGCLHPSYLTPLPPRPSCQLCPLRATKRVTPVNTAVCPEGPRLQGLHSPRSGSWKALPLGQLGVASLSRRPHALQTPGSNYRPLCGFRFPGWCWEPAPGSFQAEGWCLWHMGPWWTGSAPPSSLSGSALLPLRPCPHLSRPCSPPLSSWPLTPASPQPPGPSRTLQDQSSLPGPQSRRSGRPWGPQGSPGRGLAQQPPHFHQGL